MFWLKIRQLKYICFFTIIFSASINAAPSNPAEQELPKSVLEIQRLCSIAENSCKSEKKRKKSANDKLIDTRTLFDKEPKFPGSYCRFVF